MKREEKTAIVEQVADQLKENSHCYIADIAGLNADETYELRKKCFEKDIKLVVVKNTLLKRAFDKSESNYDELYNILEGPTSIMLSNTGNVPAKLIKEFRKKYSKPLLKGAYVEESVYIGDEQLENLTKIKSKEELIGDIIAMLQSPAQNVVSALQSGGGKIAGILKTLSEKEEN